MNLDWQKNFKTKVAKAFFFIFKSSCLERSFLDSKKREKYTKQAAFNMGQITFVTNSKVRAKTPDFQGPY
jgi:hypothetical protein